MSETKDTDNEAIRLFKIATSSDKQYRIGPSVLEREDADAVNRNRRQKAKAKKEEEEADRIHRENELRSLVGKVSLAFVAIQLFFFDAVMGIYILVSLFRGDVVPSEILIGWMSACLVEIIGILWVIARSLFPFRDKSRSLEAESGKGSKRRGK